MKAALTFLWVILLFLAVGSGAAAVPPAFRSKIWQTEDGLPRNSVTAICQTRDGFLWVGTDAGLARFDGVEFDTYPITGSPEKLPAITALAGDSGGGLWVGTAGGGLYFFQNEQWSSRNGVLTNAGITCLHQGRDKVVWIGTRKGLWRSENNVISHFESFAPLSTNYIRSLFEDKQSRMWVSYSVGLACLVGGEVQTNYDAAGEFPDPLIRTAIVDKRGSLWVGTRNGLNRRGTRVTTFSKADGLPDNIVSALHEDSRGILWVGTYGGVARRESAQFFRETTRRGDAIDQVFCFHEDHEGNLWAGTKEGLFQFTPQYCQAFTRRDGLAHNNVITVLAGERGEVWAGTWGGGLNLIVSNKVVAHFNHARVPEMKNDLILALYPRVGGGVWFGTDFGGGLYELRPNGRSWKCVRYEATNGPALKSIRAITRDARENLWVGTTGGLYRLETNTLVQCQVSESTNESVRCFLPGRDGKFWIGLETGLICCHGDKTNVYTTADGLTDNRIMALHEDAAGALWIGTMQGGLNRLIFTNNAAQFVHYTVEDGLHNNTVLEILETEDGFLWMSSYHGIFRIAKDDFKNYQRGKSAPLRCLAFGQEEGMESTVCVGAAKPAGCQSADGRLWFPTTKGLVAVTPDIPLNQKAPPVTVRKIIADKRSFPINESQKQRTNSPLLIPPGRGEIEFHFSALSYQSPKNNLYKYKLEGMDEDWVGPISRRMASYNNLRPGHYVFRVIACNNHGIWNDDGAVLTFDWQPHFWQTWVFKLMMTGLVGLVLFGVDRARVARLHEVERLRLRIAADLHDEVGSNLGSVSMLARLLQKSKTMTPEEQKDVALIERVTAETANAVKDIVWFTSPTCDTMEDMLMRMKDTAETMLAGIECVFESDIENMTAKLSLEFRKNVFLIFKEALANISKHSQATRVEVFISERESTWKLFIHDNGVGFDRSALSRGNGLKNFQCRAETLGGVFEVQTTPGGGTTLQLLVDSNNLRRRTKEES